MENWYIHTFANCNRMRLLLKRKLLLNQQLIVTFALRRRDWLLKTSVCCCRSLLLQIACGAKIIFATLRRALSLGPKQPSRRRTPLKRSHSKKGHRYFGGVRLKLHVSLSGLVSNFYASPFLAQLTLSLLLPAKLVKCAFGGCYWNMKWLLKIEIQIGTYLWNWAFITYSHGGKMGFQRLNWI